MWWAIFDFEYEKKVFMQRPELYKIGLKDEKFSTGIFWSWNLYGSYQALLVMYFCLIFPDAALCFNGKQYSLWPGGMMAYFACVVIANFVFIRMTNTFAFWGELLSFLQATAYYWITFLYSILITTSDIYSFFGIFNASRSAWLGFFICILSVCLTDFIIAELWFKYIYKNPKKSLYGRIITAIEEQDLQNKVLSAE